MSLPDGESKEEPTYQSCGFRQRPTSSPLTLAVTLSRRGSGCAPRSVRGKGGVPKTEEAPARLVEMLAARHVIACCETCRLASWTNRLIQRPKSHRRAVQTSAWACELRGACWVPGDVVCGRCWRRCGRVRRNTISVCKIAGRVRGPRTGCPGPDMYSRIRSFATPQSRTLSMQFCST